MSYKFTIKLFLIGLLAAALSGCQQQVVSNQTNSNSTVNSANHAASPTVETKIPAPQPVKFESAEKVEIVGTFYESPQANSPAVLLLHQFGSNRKSYDDLAKRLQAKNFGVLAIDGRGFGESVKTADGKAFTINQNSEAIAAETVGQMKTDVDNAFNFLAKQKNVDAARIGIVGASYGSSLAIIYAAENQKVKAVALLSPGVNYFGKMPTEPAVKNFGSRPLLLIAADDDSQSADSVKKLNAANAKSETKIYSKGGHGTDLFAAKVGLEDLLEQFLTTNL